MPNTALKLNDFGASDTFVSEARRSGSRLYSEFARRTQTMGLGRWLAWLSGALYSFDFHKTSMKKDGGKSNFKV
jgi:hypothetical protein